MRKTEKYLYILYKKVRFMNLNAYVIREFLKEPVLWDSIREELRAMGVEVTDTKEGASWRRV